VSEPIRILFDENFGEPLVSALARFLAFDSEPKELRHLFKFAKESEADDIWVPKIAPGGWTVITTDRGKKSATKKLPQICCENGVTHVLVSASIHQAKQFEKARAVVAVWPEIVAATRGDKGRRFSLRYNGPRHRVILVECPTPAVHAPTRIVLPFSRSQRKRGRRSGRRRQPRDDPKQMKMFWNPQNNQG
jgi:hypothetical protein